jgi:hypothetical protein
LLVAPAFCKSTNSHTPINMNSLVFLPLLVAAVIAAPGGVHHQLPASTSLIGAPAPAVVAAPVVAAAPVPAVTYAAAPAVTYAAAPAVAHVSVPVTKTVHYETKPVITGYSQQIIKPAIPYFEAPALQAVSVQQHVVSAPAVQQVQQVQAVQQVAAPAVVADAEIVEARAAAVPVAAPVVQQQVSVVAPQVVAVRAAQAGDFGPLVTKEQVLAPVRTHTQIIPQVTRVEPEVTVRKVVHNVDIAQPIVQQQVITQVNQPVLARAVHSNVISGHHTVFGHHTGLVHTGLVGQQFVL